MSRQRSAVRAPPGRVVLAQPGIPLPRLGVFFGERFEAQLQLFLRYTFGLGTDLHPLQLQQQVA